MSMLRPLRYHRLRLEILNKPGGKDRRAPNNSGLKYGIRFPGNAKEAAQFDQKNGNKIWANAILKELEALMSMKLFRKLPLSLRKARAKGFQFALLRMIFDVKVDLRRKARIVIGGHVVDSSRNKVYPSTMKSVSARILMKILAENNLDVMTGDIGNAYLNTNTQENIYTHAGTEFELVGIMSEGNLLEVIKALYGLPTSRNRWHAHLSHNLREMGLKPTRFDPYVWIRGREGGYDYTGMHTNDVLIVSVEPTSTFDKLKETYTIKAFGLPKVHIGCDYAQVKKGATTRWIMGRYTYITECLMKVCALIKVTSL